MGVWENLYALDSYSLLAFQSGAAPLTRNVNSWYVKRKQPQDTSVKYLNIRSLARVLSQEPQTLPLVHANNFPHVLNVVCFLLGNSLGVWIQTPG